MMGIIVKILREIYKTPLILLHAARLKTCLTGVWPAVDLSWKALAYGLNASSCNPLRQFISRNYLTEHIMVNIIFW